MNKEKLEREGTLPLVIQVSEKAKDHLYDNIVVSLREEMVSLVCVGVEKRAAKLVVVCDFGIVSNKMNSLDRSYGVLTLGDVGRLSSILRVSPLFT
jgi:hypothetical protein